MMDTFEKGTILYELKPHCDALLPVMRNEKEKKGYIKWMNLLHPLYSSVHPFYFKWMNEQ